MALGALTAVRDLPRLHEISRVLIRHGLGDLVQRIGIGTVLERAGQILHWNEGADAAGIEPPERVRMALEELGPTFIKLGQILSTRQDMFGPEWIAEFDKLRSSAAPVPFESLLPEIEAALGCPPDEVFAELDTDALAAASIAQVHRASLTDGTPVVLKVRRPGIRATVEADLRILGHVSRLLESEVPEARQFRPVLVLAEFARSMERELDLAAEARNVDRFAKHFADDPNVLIPRVHWQWTSERMNVQDYIDAIPGTDLAAIEAHGLDRKLLARRGAEAILKMILVHGFFHADPHPGNVFYVPGNRIVMIDFGMVGRLPGRRRDQIVDLLAGMARRDVEAIVDVVLEWTGDTLVDEQRLAVDLDQMLFDYADAALKDIRIAQLLREVAATMRNHSIALPADLTLMFKALITLEGLGRQYDPDFLLIDQLKPYLEHAVAQRYQPKTLVARGQAGISHMLSAVSGIPREMSRMLKDARRGRMRIDVDVKRLDDFVRRLDETIDRITIGIMTASLVIGSSIVMTVQSGPELFGVHAFTLLGLVGYVVAFVNSVWIVVSIWRSTRS